MKIRFLLLGTSLSLIPQTINAQCVATQDCATLGYTETSCSGGTGVKCPFGNKWACFKSESEYEQEFCTKYRFTQTCTGTNQTGGVGQACNGKYSECTCTWGYVWNATNRICKIHRAVCEIGTLFYSDNTCSNFLENSKTLLGVVIYSNGASGGGWIMTVNPIKNSSIAWNTDSYSAKYYSTGITDKAVSASCTNTQKLVALGSKFEAANAANNYKPAGTPNGKSWCLPSYNLLNNLNNSTNLKKINAGITTAGGNKLGYNMSIYDYEALSSSSEYSDSSIWSILITQNGQTKMIQYDKGRATSGPYVRPVMEF